MRFFRAVRTSLAKRAPTLPGSPSNSITPSARPSRVIAPKDVMDIFAAAGLPKPDISILSDELLAEVRAFRNATWPSMQ